MHSVGGIKTPIPSQFDMMLMLLKATITFQRSCRNTFNTEGSNNLSLDRFRHHVVFLSSGLGMGMFEKFVKMFLIFVLKWIIVR